MKSNQNKKIIETETTSKKNYIYIYIHKKKKKKKNQKTEKNVCLKRSHC